MNTVIALSLLAILVVVPVALIWKYFHIGFRLHQVGPKSVGFWSLAYFTVASVATATFLVWGFANLIGFSWQSLSFPSESEMMQAAIERVYGSRFHSESELRAAFPEKKIAVYFGADWAGDYSSGPISEWLGFSYYQVVLPENVVIFDKDGNLVTTNGECFESLACN